MTLAEYVFGCIGLLLAFGLACLLADRKQCGTVRRASIDRGAK